MNWAIPKEGESVRLGEVQALCAKLGPKWRMPREDEVERMKPVPPLGVMPTRLANAAYTNYWLWPTRDASPAQDVFLQVLCMNKQCRPEVQREPKDRSGPGENKGAARPDENELLEWEQGRLSGGALARLEEHLDGCAACSAVVAGLKGGGGLPVEGLESMAPLGPGGTPEPGTRVGRYVLLRCPCWSGRAGPRTWRSPMS